jgi:hypothetical protein
MTIPRCALTPLLLVSAAAALAQPPGRVGVVAGVVRLDDTMPLVDALVHVEGRPAIRTASDGHFLVDSVAVGRRRVDVRALGRSPESTTLIVMANDTSRVVITLSTITTLDSVRISAPSFRSKLMAQYEQRKKAGWGQFRDSTTIASRPSLASVFTELPFPSMVVREQRGGAPFVYMPASPIIQGVPNCLATLFVDGVRSNQSELARYGPTDIAALEVYNRADVAPMEFQNGKSKCGVIVVWTKLFLPP